MQFDSDMLNTPFLSSTINQQQQITVTALVTSTFREKENFPQKSKQVLSCFYSLIQMGKWLVWQLKLWVKGKMCPQKQILPQNTNTVSNYKDIIYNNLKYKFKQLYLI